MALGDNPSRFASLRVRSPRNVIQSNSFVGSFCVNYGTLLAEPVPT